MFISLTSEESHINDSSATCLLWPQGKQSWMYTTKRYMYITSTEITHANCYTLTYIQETGCGLQLTISLKSLIVILN